MDNRKPDKNNPLRRIANAIRGAYNSAMNNAPNQNAQERAASARLGREVDNVDNALRLIDGELPILGSTWEEDFNSRFNERLAEMTSRENARIRQAVAENERRDPLRNIESRMDPRMRETIGSLRFPAERNEIRPPRNQDYRDQNYREDDLPPYEEAPTYEQATNKPGRKFSGASASSDKDGLSKK